MEKKEINAGSLSPADTTNGSNGKNSTSAMENSNMISTATANDAVCNDEVVINKENSMDKEDTKSAGISHPAANTDNLGDSVTRDKRRKKFVPSVAAIVTKNITPEIRNSKYNGRAWYHWGDFGKFCINNYEDLLEVAHQVCDILHHHAKEIVEVEGIDNSNEVLFAPLLYKHAGFFGSFDFKCSIKDKWGDDTTYYKLHNRIEGVICYGGIHLSDWLVRPTGLRFCNIVGALLLDELDYVADAIGCEIDSEEVYNTSTYARAHWSSYEEMQKFFALREANRIANGGHTSWCRAAFGDGQTFNHEIVA